MMNLKTLSTWLAAAGILLSSACTASQLGPAPETEPGLSPTPAVTPADTPGPQRSDPPAVPSEDFSRDGWLVFRSDEPGYHFHYPGGIQVRRDDPQPGSVSLTGPLIGDDYWPQIIISHPSDREGFNPPEEVDLEAWLLSHNLLADERLPDLQIGGTTAIHTRLDRSPQSYACDRYYFARAGQLYQIIIGHAGDKEDWIFYERFLRSFQFEE
jgi:hypothetical protein